MAVSFSITVSNPRAAKLRRVADVANQQGDTLTAELIERRLEAIRGPLVCLPQINAAA